MYYGQLEPQSNRADWQDSFVVVDDDTGDLVDISGCRITMTVRQIQSDRANYRNPFLGYTNTYSDFGFPPSAIVLTGSTDTGEIVVVGLGVFQWLYPMDRVQMMMQGDYQVGVRIAQVGRVEQVIIATVNFYEGLDMQ